MPPGKTLLLALFSPILGLGCGVEKKNYTTPADSFPRLIRADDSVIPTARAQDPNLAKDDRELFAVNHSEGGKELLSEAFVLKTVLERNPTLDQMRAAANAVQARYPQVMSLDDPSLNISTAPGSAWSGNADFAARTEITQKIPYPGKRELRGQVVLAEARAGNRDVADTRLQLIELSKSAFADYLLAEKLRQNNEQGIRLVTESRNDAASRYKNGLGPQQYVLQADVELARQQERSLAIERGRKVAQARLNLLMHRTPDSPLPEPPNEIPTTGSLEDAVKLRSLAIEHRPDLKALADRIAADEATVALALREYKPDVELMAAYDGFWQGPGGLPLQWQLGARVNLPVRLARRDAAVLEAQAKLAQRRAEYSRLSDQVGFQVQEAYEQALEAEKVIRLYEKSLLPAAEGNVKEAQSLYSTAKIPFLTLIDAQRTLIERRERFLEIQADYYRRRATLDRVVGTEK